jgi:DNA-directed RNA polymerase subunit omega
MLPKPDILNDYPYGKFVLSNLAAKRAKQLGEGAPALVHVDSKHPLTIALAEIAAGKIKPILPDKLEAIDIAMEVDLLVDESVSERGMLLPALDEAEVVLISDDTILADDDVEELVDPEETMSLSDLVGEEEETEIGDDGEGTLSLNDLAEKESSDEDDSASE